MNVVFYLSGAVAILATILVITRIDPVHALLYAVVSLLAVSLVFFSLGAPFIAALEVIVYAGAIMVLFVFVVMLLNLGRHTRERERSWLRPSMWVGPAVLCAILLGELCYALYAGPGSNDAPIASAVVSPREVGAALFGPYVLMVELAAMLLTAGLVGAYHLGRSTEEKA